MSRNHLSQCLLGYEEALCFICQKHPSLENRRQNDNPYTYMDQRIPSLFSKKLPTDSPQIGQFVPFQKAFVVLFCVVSAKQSKWTFVDIENGNG